MLKFLRKQLNTLLEERASMKADLDSVLATPTTEARDLTESEAAAFAEARAKVIAQDVKIDEMRSRVVEAEEDEARELRVAALKVETGKAGGSEERAGTSPARVTSEPETYRKNGQTSYFRDLVSVSLQRGDARQASERLERNNREVIESRALSTTDGAGGDYVPPLWMVQDAVALARAARPTADRVRNMTLPTGTDSVNLPKMLTGTAVAEQTVQNTAVQATDATTGTVTANVATIAGQQIVAVQLIEQSPANLDVILLADLAADYAAKVDLFVLNNNAVGKKGLLQEAGTNAVTYTSASPTAGALYSQIANASQLVGSGRFLAADTIIMHPRRWAYFLAAVDSTGRPLVNPTPFNGAAMSNGPTAGQGIAGNIQGLDVILDAQIPTNLGAGTNQDVILVIRADDHILMEGTARSEAFRETKADQLSVLLRFYNYAAFTAARYQKSISVISGTGLVAPTF